MSDDDRITVATVTTNGGWDEYPQEFDSIEQAEAWIIENFGDFHDRYILVNGVSIG